MKIENLDKENFNLVITDDVSVLNLTRASSLFPKLKGWIVDWKLIENKEYKTGMQGRILYSREDIELAFHLFRQEEDISVSKEIKNAVQELLEEAKSPAAIPKAAPINAPLKNLLLFLFAMLFFIVK
jgi:hypothetical protein